MKTIVVSVLLVLALAAGYQGYIYSEFQTCLKVSEDLFYGKEYSRALAAIDNLRGDRWYKPIKNYKVLDLFEIEKELDYQKGFILAESGKLNDAYASFEKCVPAKSQDLASHCLYQQGNLAFYQGRVNTAENKWRASMEKSFGGHDFDAQVNLELLKNEQKKSSAVAKGNMLTHRRGTNPFFFLRPPSQKNGPPQP